MESETFDINFQDHFKLYVLFKDIIVFEHELQLKHVSFHVDPGEAFLKNERRYFLLEKDQFTINEIIKKKGIVASTETITMTDYTDVRKVNTLLLYIVVVVVVLLIVTALII